MFFFLIYCLYFEFNVMKKAAEIKNAKKQEKIHLLLLWSTNPWKYIQFN